VDLCPVGALTSKDFRFQMRVWFLKETKSLCTSCATGCNILIGSRENQVFRYVPRPNDAVNSCWMCDHGRLNYKWIGRPDRLLQCQVRDAEGKLQPKTWAEAIQETAARLKPAVPGSVAILASARQTNEELFLLGHLARKLGAAIDSAPRLGEGDDWLVSADKNPNSVGARLLLGGDGATSAAARLLGANLPKIAEGIRRGEIRTLLVFGEDACKHLGSELLGRLDHLMVSDILPNATTRLAHVLLPGCAHAEKRGSFTNLKGRVQKFIKAVEAPGQARPESEFLVELVLALTGDRFPQTAEGLFNRMARETPAFGGVTWAALGQQGQEITPGIIKPD
jgi:NADH-quinone oxidoreductase subunit G